MNMTSHTNAHSDSRSVPEPTHSLRREFYHLAERLYLLSSLLMLVNAGRMILPAPTASTGGSLFKYVAWLGYSFMYSLPLFLLILVAGTLLGMRAHRSLAIRRYRLRVIVFCVLAVAGLFVTQALIYADSWVYAIFQFHLNGFVLNLLMTPGGLASMDMSDGSTWGFALRLGVILILQVGLLVLAMRSRLLKQAFSRILRGVKSRMAFMVILVLLLAGQATAYGFARATWYRPVLRAADAIPFYVPVTFNHLARAWGWDTTDANLPSVDDASLSLHYPLHPLALRADSPRYNIVILMCETLRADMLTPEIMPHTSAFASRCLQCTRHYSSGNSTREGVFGAMTGLHGTYWRNMLRDNRGSAIVQLLQKEGYDMELFTSQSFTYPEFDRTVFATVPPKHMHVRSDGDPSWRRDRKNVSDITQWLDTRKRERPFITFMFFESSHARYAFPPESVIRPDFCEVFDYGNDLINPTATQVRQVFNRYINAVHHLDSQLGRVIDYLDTSGQLEHTIVIITGDHGDAFYEHGRWGHGGQSFLDEQIHVPLLMFLPGEQPRVIHEMTSHVDIMPTVLTTLGIENPPQDYSVGRNLLAASSSSAYVVCSGWDTACLMSGQYKYTFPFKGFHLPEAFTIDDQPLDEAIVRRELQPQLVDLMKKMRLFLK